MIRALGKQNRKIHEITDLYALGTIVQIFEAGVHKAALTKLSPLIRTKKI